MRSPLCFLVLMAATLSAQVPPTRPSAMPSGPSAKPGAIEGTVTNQLTHAAVRKATITLSSQQAGFSLVAVTDDSGKFLVPGVDPDSYTIQDVSAQGYRYESSNRADTSITVTEDQHVTGVKIELTPLGVISGKIVDDDGEPMREVSVEAMTYEYSRGTRRFSNTGGATTDDRGEFRIFDLAPGRYFVLARPSRSTYLQAPVPNLHSTIPELGYPPLFFPNAHDPSEATVSSVTAGNETSGINFRLRALPVYHIRGKVANLPKSSQRQLSAIDCGSSVMNMNPTQFNADAQADGTFDFWGVPPGTYCITLDPHERSQLQSVYFAQMVVVSNRSLDGVNLTAAPLLPVTGAVRIEGQPGVPPNWMMSLQRADYWNNFNVPVKDGKFSIAGVAPGTYQMMMRGMAPNLYIKSIQYGTDDLSGGDLPIRGDGSVLTLVVGADSGSLSGMVQTERGDPAPMVLVTVAPDDSLSGRQDLIRMTMTDSAGKFQVQGLAPGSYKVFGWDDSNLWGIATSPEFRKEFSSYAAAVTVSPNGKHTVLVKAVPAEEIRRVRARF